MKKIYFLTAIMVLLCPTKHLFGQVVPYSNTSVGHGTVEKGDYNSTFGFHCGGSLNNNAGFNNFFGARAGENVTTGDDNVFFGSFAGWLTTTGEDNTYIGRAAGHDASYYGSGNVFIGNEAGYYQTGSNKLVIGNNRNDYLIYGEFDKNLVKINGRFQVTESLTLYDALYFTKGGNHSDGLPIVRLVENWGLRFNAPDSKYAFSSKNSVLVGFDPDGTDYGNGNLYVQNSFGVGTTSPSTIFEINTGVKANQNALAKITGEYNPGLEIYSKSDWNPRLLLTTNDGADKWEMNVAGNWDNRGLSFQYNNSNWLTIAKNGNVGIGAINPAYKLEVEGTVKADNFVSSTASFPDYIFSQEHEVMPLKELESFVNENKHLPNMPSEKEVVEQGMNISDVTIKSVENIETIYLHLIELQKQVEVLKAELKKHTTQQ